MMPAMTSWPILSSQWFIDHPPSVNPPLRSSSGPPGACMTPSSVTNVVTISSLIAIPPGAAGKGLVQRPPDEDVAIPQGVVADQVGRVRVESNEAAVRGDRGVEAVAVALHSR